jgi:hypothetical protein
MNIWKFKKLGLHEPLPRKTRLKPKKNEKLPRIVLVLLPGLFYVVPAYAYLDPGTGSIILQSMLAGIATAAALGSMFWQRIKAFFSFLFSSKKLTDYKSESGADE